MQEIDFNSLPAAGSISDSKNRFIYCAQQGLLKHALPNKFSGYDNSFKELIDQHRTLGYESQDTGLVLSINAHLWGLVFPLFIYGNPKQQDLWLNQAISGQLIGGHAITEPQAGSDIDALQAIASYANGDVVLKGHKRFISNTPIADLLVVYAKLDDQLTAFIVSRNDPGVTFTTDPTVSACQTATMGDVLLENCHLPDNRILGKPGMGKLIIQRALELERAFIFAGIAGIMQWQLEQTIAYSRTRTVQGAHLGKNQAISHKIAEMKVRLDTTRLWLNECARLADNKQRITLASAQTKYYASEAFLQSSLDAVQILGAQGMATENSMAGLVSDAQASRLFSGSSEIQKNIIAALSGTGDGFKSR